VRIFPGATVTKKLLYYSIAASLVGFVASAMGIGMGWSLFLGVTVPPALALVWVLRRLV
jgi:hypothetical protein